MGWNWKQGRSCPSLGCSVRPFAGANCPHRTPLNCVFFDCGEYGLENQSGADKATFSDLGGFLYGVLVIVIVFNDLYNNTKLFDRIYVNHLAPLKHFHLI